MTSIPLRLRLCAGLAAPALLLGAALPAAAAAPPPVTINFNIDAGSLESALLAFAQQSGEQLLYSSRQIAGRRAPAIRGLQAPDQVLARLLEGTGLVAQRARPHVLVLRAPTRLAVLGARPQDPLSDAAPVAPGGGDGSPDIPSEATARAPAVLDELVVTGSLIRGQADPVSPAVQFDRDAIDRGGYATVADMLQALPQNFAGSATANTSLVSSDTRGSNDTMATGVNLRGLGAQATLVLVNGRRLGGAGLRGDFGDLSQIPTAAIARVDVLLDGASALYGSDAVGGVVNVVLKRRFAGAETRLRIGTATQGGGGEEQLGQLLGRTWDGGGLVVAYEHEHRDAVAGADRAVSATTDLRGLGGTDRRLPYSHPANILRFDAASGAYVPAYAVPAGQNGVGLKPTDFLAGQVNLQNIRQGADLYPRQDRDSVYVSLEQDLGAKVRLSADLRFSRRAFELRRTAALSVFQVTRTNPFFVSPNGSASLVVGYSFADELGAPLTRGSAESLGASAGFDVVLPGDWRGEAYVAHAAETGRRVVSGQLNSRFLNEALGVLADDPATAYVAARDGYFNPFGAGGANGPAVLGFISSGYTRSVSASTVDSLNLKGDGPLWTLPGGPLKAAFGVQGRRERFEPRSVTLLSRAVPTSAGTPTYERTVSAAFLELRAPLIGPDNPQPWAQKLELSAAGRIERYDDVGQTSNPKFGLLWAPVASVRLRATYGTSFRAPNLPEVYDTQAISSTLLPNGAGQSAALFLTGGNRDLKPEKATSWTAGIDYQSRAWPGLTASLTWFDVDFSGQIGQPVVADSTNALTNPAYAPFVRRVSAANAADLAYVRGLIAQPGAAVSFPAESIAVVVDARSVNAARVAVEGLDLTAGYAFEVGSDRWDLASSATYLLRFDRRYTPAAPVTGLVNTVGQPLSLRARVSATWTRDAWSLLGGLNYANAYKAPDGRRIDASSTADLQLRWAPVSGRLKDVVLALNVQNLFDAAPPFYDNPLGLGYDPANGDPMGRQVSLQLTRRW